MLRADAAHFIGFGEIYFSSINGGMVKGWRRHRRMTLNLAVPVGRVRLVLYDDREGSASYGLINEATLGHDSYKLVVVPPGIWCAFQGLDSTSSVIANCASIPHEPNEADNRPLSDPPVAVTW